ncbi:MAG: hypothetical protein IPK82_34890 [Polyangiaceae bacterium]|nr:hypothetical protein [Polyangiaceae bacterium]
MGVDFTAVCDHQLDWAGLYALPAALTQSWVLPEELEGFVQEHLRQDTAPWCWARNRAFSSVEEELFEANQLTLLGPHGFIGVVFRTVVEVSHLARWWSFLEEQNVHIGLRRACLNIAHLVKARHLVYLPDSWLPPSQKEISR